MRKTALASLFLLTWGISVVLAADMGEIASGYTSSGSITQPGQQDTWTISGSAGDRIFISAKATSGSLHPYITVYGPSGGSSLTSASEFIELTFSQSGVHKVVLQDGVSGAGDTYSDDVGPYNISYVRLADDTWDALTCGHTLSSTISAPSGMKVFMFDGNQGDRVYINTVRTSGSLTPGIGLFPPGNGTSEAGGARYVEHVLQASGTYKVVVVDWFAGEGAGDGWRVNTGDFNITYANLSACTWDSLTCGYSVSSSIDAYSDVDVFTFKGIQGDQVQIAVEKTWGSLNPGIGVLPPGNGEGVAGGERFVEHVLEASGMYKIVIMDWGAGAGDGGWRDDIGGYTLTLTGDCDQTVDLTKDLMAYWPFSGDAQDASGNGNHGTVHGATLVSGRSGSPEGAFHFDGINDYVEVPHDESLLPESDVTVMAWINTPRHAGSTLSDYADWQPIITKEEPRLYTLSTYVDGRLHFSLGSKVSYVSSFSSERVPLNEWTHVCAMLDNGRMVFYIDGVRAGTGDGGHSLPRNNFAPLRIGYDIDGNNAFQGKIDDVRIYNGAKTQKEINLIMRSELPSTAWKPSPANEAEGVSRRPLLTWIPGKFAEQHHVYFGVNPNDVNEASLDDPRGVHVATDLKVSEFQPEGPLDHDTTYYWRVDEVNSVPDFAIHRGGVWRFTTLSAQDPIFYEGFESREAVVEHGGLRNQNGWISFVEGVSGNAGDFSGSRAVNFLREGNYSPWEGTVYFWVKFPNANGLGLWDIGNLSTPNSWGIFKNMDHVIMEVKNRNNSYDQAWSPGPVPYDGEWHFISAPWERVGSTTYFAVCVDGNCKTFYDGVTNHSYPETDGDDDIWIGWSGWYGYSQSIFDEFKIFDHAKSNQEIYEDYLAEVPLEN